MEFSQNEFWQHCMKLTFGQLLTFESVQTDLPLINFKQSSKMKAMLVIFFIFSCILLNLGQAKNVSEIQFPLQSGELNGRMVIKDQK